MLSETPSDRALDDSTNEKVELAKEPTEIGVEIEDASWAGLGSPARIDSVVEGLDAVTTPRFRYQRLYRTANVPGNGSTSLDAGRAFPVELPVMRATAFRIG